jgi:hypothetical protein
MNEDNGEGTKKKKKNGTEKEEEIHFEFVNRGMSPY